MKYLIPAIVFAFIIIPSIAFGQTGLVTCEGPDCNWCSFVAMVNRIVTWLIAFLSVLAVIVMVYAGFLMVTSGGNKDAWTKGKSMLTKVVVGIIIVLAAWLIVDTLLRMLTDRGGINEWMPKDCGGIYQPTIPPNPLDPLNTLTGTSTVTVGGTGKYTDAEARALLEQNKNITVWESAPGRTQLGGINKATLNEAIRLQQACGCRITITGGTESGHAQGTYSHGTGYKIDLDDTPALNNFIKFTYERRGTRSDGATLYYNDTIEYALEGDHWDVTVR